jgi:PAS domain S-box-containing protein
MPPNRRLHFGHQPTGPEPSGQGWPLDVIAAAVIAAGPDGKIFYSNAAAEELYGYSGSELSGAHGMDLLVRPGDREYAAALWRRLQLGQTLTYDFEVWRAGGGVLPVRVSDRPLWEGARFAGVVGVHVRVEAALATGPEGGPARRAGAAEPGWASVTAGELRVVRLVAQGLTNREVAARLYLSQHTVDSHLKSVYTKLGVSSRVQLTRELFRHGGLRHPRHPG